MKRGIIDTSYLSRVIYKEHDENTGAITGTYKLMLRAKSMPSPTSAPNPVEITDFEDNVQCYTLGIKQSDAKEFTGNLDRLYFDDLLRDEGKRVDVIQLYGRDGVGGLAKSVYVGQFSPTVNDLGGTDEVIEMTCTVVQNTAPAWVTDQIVVTDNEDGTFTVSAAPGTPEVVLNKSNITLGVGESIRLIATTTPSGETVTWSSSASGKASVDSRGYVTGVEAGTATITATITVDTVDYTDTCAVTVSGV